MDTRDKNIVLIGMPGVGKSTVGVVIEQGQTIRSLYDQRQPLYRRYTHLTLDCTDKSHEQVVSEIIHTLAR